MNRERLEKNRENPGLCYFFLININVILEIDTVTH